IPSEASPELRDGAERAFAVLRTAIEQLIATMPVRNRPPVLMMTLHIWALSHGIASLFGRGDAAKRSLPMSPEDFVGSSRVDLSERSRLRRASEPWPFCIVRPVRYHRTSR